MSDAILQTIPNCSDITMVKHISNNKFCYTTNKGITHYYLVFKSYKAYKTGVADIPHKLIKSNSFYIVKTEAHRRN